MASGSRSEMRSSEKVVITLLGDADVDIVQWALYTAISWTNDPDIPALDVAVQHPEIARYHQSWGRSGDIGVRADLDDEFAGAAFARLFTDDDHGHGYVDEKTPELGMGVVREFRGRGIGRRLMLELAAVATGEGFGRLSLSVNNPNRAKRLYESLGYVTVKDDGGSSVMVLDI